MADFYPFIDPHLVGENLKEPPLACEYAYDMDTANFKYKDGKMYKVYKNDALKIKIWKLFMSERYRWVVFPWSYGHELETLIGQAYTQGYVNSEAERYCKEAIERALEDYIIRLEEFKVNFDEGILYISFKAITIYGQMIVDNLIVRG
ncbi:hypothetical protein ABID14_000343 [Peptoniphilus olsenii]|uniref:DUF2634 domain-containing protein n=1 Tax=Peptoniphilus olsenii TaxID=411570 RepID=A0ABV2J7G7_9FIRM